MSIKLDQLSNSELLQYEKTSGEYTCEVASELALRCAQLMKNMSELIYAYEDLTENDSFDNRDGEAVYFEDLKEQCETVKYIHQLKLILKDGVVLEKSYISFNRTTTFAAANQAFKIHSTWTPITEEEYNILKVYMEIVPAGKEFMLVGV